ncbi:WD40 repeat domain-containing protein [Nostoc sp. 'Lobaria pulmonaria (5183) cyanobiont']|uniref:WD40 repeat domain-containing protein n=1 Tax=Nostoc sp. 'Lobaria pulmonaria (5183) cyanobiont' TaxID=1618022 RepID=UPI000CF30549|nr:WD40 repeat domain-containing protein [Nostoc sp. 'Lobaria pulmonaria (5183) cyanobiont']AVH71454.1 WD40 repeat-containing protein [Nostoc sp. 'Lobaria pulmonaria (5183) cyanobiont']
MTENKPKEYDVIVGGHQPPPLGGVVLGGLEGAKHRLSSNILEERIAALYELFNYGESGLNLLIHALKDESEQVQNKAYSLLLSREEENVKELLLQYKPWQFFEYLRTTIGHSSSVCCSVVSPDSQILVTGADSIKVWNLKTGKQIFSLSSPGPRYVSISPDGETLLSAFYEYGQMQLWNLKTGQLIQTLKPKDSRHPTSIIVSSDWQTVVGVKNKSIDIWDLKTKQLILNLKVYCGKLSCIALSSNGKILAGGSFDNRIRVWDLNTVKEIKTLEGHVQSVCFLAISPDNKTIVSCGDKTIKIWYLETGKLLNSFIGHKRRIVSAAISDDWQTILSYSTDKVIVNWNLNTGHQLGTYQENCETDFSLLITENGQNFITISDHMVNTWDLHTGQVIDTFSVVGHLGSISSLALSPDGLTIYSCGGLDATIKLWDSKTGEKISSLYGHSSPVHCVVTNQDGSILLSAGSDKTIKIWDVKDRQEISTLVGHSNRIFSLDISYDGKILASGDLDGNIKIWNLETKEEIYTLQQKAYSDYSRNGVFSLAISLDKKKLVSCTERLYPVLQVWNLETAEEIYALTELPVEYVKISPNGKYLISGDYNRKTIEVRALQTGKEIRTFPGQINCLTISPDGEALFVGSKDQSIQIWNLNTGELIRSLRKHSFSYHSNVLAISQNGQILVSGKGGTINIWGVQKIE